MPADTLSTLLMIAVMGVAFWFLLIRPAQRKQKAQQEMVSTLGPGVRVLTTAGVFATIREMGAKTAVIEISPGVEMTVLKQAVMRTVTADEEEFEYDDEADAAASADAPLDEVTPEAPEVPGDRGHSSN